MSPFERNVLPGLAKKLIGRTIVGVGYMDPESAAEMGWDERPVVFTLDDGTHLFPMRDDEGNGPGAMESDREDGLGFPVVPL